MSLRFDPDDLTADIQAAAREQLDPPPEGRPVKSFSMEHEHGGPGYVVRTWEGGEAGYVVSNIATPEDLRAWTSSLMAGGRVLEGPQGAVVVARGIEYPRCAREIRRSGDKSLGRCPARAMFGDTCGNHYPLLDGWEVIAAHGLECPACAQVTRSAIALATATGSSVGTTREAAHSVTVKRL